MSEMAKERKALMEIVEDIIDESNAKNMECLMSVASGTTFPVKRVDDYSWGYKKGLDTVVAIIGRRLEQNDIGEIEKNDRVCTFEEVRLVEYTEKESAEHAAWNEDKDENET